MPLASDLQRYFNVVELFNRGGCLGAYIGVFLLKCEVFAVITKVDPGS